MIIRSVSSSTEYAIGLLRSAQNRLTTTGSRMSSGQQQPAYELLRQIKMAKTEQSIAMTLLSQQKVVDGNTLDILA